MNTLKMPVRAPLFSVLWIAMLAILFSALAPALVHAYSAQAPGASAMPAAAMEICTMDGVIMLPGDGAPHPADHVFEHCPYCFTQGHPPFLPPQSQLVFALLPTAERYPPLFYQVPRGLHAWTAANPRGPPSVS